MKSYMPPVVEILNKKLPTTVLDAPSGLGGLLPMLKFNPEIDGIDLFELKPNGYRSFYKTNLDAGIPDKLPKYDAIVSCEGIEHIGNPLLFLKTVKKHLSPGGVVIITTPNVWYPAAKLQYLLRGFFPSFPSLVGKIISGTHMHITPWSFPQLFLYLSLSGFVDIKLHDTIDKKPKHFFERIFGYSQKKYCLNRLKKSSSQEEISFWEMAGSSQSIFGRRLVVSAGAIN